MMILLAMTGLFGEARATTMVQLDVCGMAGIADAVLLGRVESATAEKFRAKVVTNAHLKVERVLHSTTAVGPELVVTLPGGELNGARSFVPGVELPEGVDIVLFVAKHDSRWTLPALGQGILRVHGERLEPFGTGHFLLTLDRNGVWAAPRESVVLPSTVAELERVLAGCEAQ